MDLLQFQKLFVFVMGKNRMITRAERKKCPDYYWEFVTLICTKCSCLSLEYVLSEVFRWRGAAEKLFQRYPSTPYELPEVVAARICCGYFGKWNHHDDYINWWIRQMMPDIEQLYRDSFFQLASKPDRIWDRLPGYPKYSDGEFERFEKYRNEGVEKVMPLWKKWSEEDQIKKQLSNKEK